MQHRVDYVNRPCPYHTGPSAACGDGNAVDVSVLCVTGNGFRLTACHDQVWCSGKFNEGAPQSHKYYLPTADLYHVLGKVHSIDRLHVGNPSICVLATSPFGLGLPPSIATRKARLRFLLMFSRSPESLQYASFPHVLHVFM